MSFGKRLKSLLAKKRQSQMDFALRLGITRSRLCNYINDRSEPDYATLCTIAEALQVSVDYLLGRNGIQDSGKQNLLGLHYRTGKTRFGGDDGLDSPVSLPFRDAGGTSGPLRVAARNEFIRSDWRIPPALRHHRR